jgi:cytochrome c nitrite reductase small subunit
MPSYSAFLLSVLLGIMTGLGVFTFRFAEGFSYFTSDPDACANCRIMRDYQDA